MRRALCAALLGGVSALAAIAPAASADSPWTPVTDPLGTGSPNGSVTHPAGANCSFPLLVSVVANKERQRQRSLGPPAPAGTIETDVRGHLVLSFTNTDTGATVVRNVSGPNDTVVYPDGTGVQTGSGKNWWTFGRFSRANTGYPGAFITTGPFELDFGGIIGISFHAKHYTDLCRLLGGSSA